MGFGKDFAWGAASSSYQVEGAAREDGKGLSVWDDFCRQPGRITGGHTGEVACDHYHRYPQDIALMKEIGLKAYRFSVSWPRVLPQGDGEINEKGLDFYDRLVDALLEAGITPYATLFHWELPLALHRRGGWLNPRSPHWFARYAELVTRRLSDRVTNFFTINEPQCFCSLGYCSGIHAPGLRLSPTDAFAMAHHVLLAHGHAVMAMRSAAKQPIRLGFAPTGAMHYPASDRPEDVEAARQAFFALHDHPQSWFWNTPWWGDPVFFGHYPQEGLKLYEKYLPPIGQDDMSIIAQPVDFLGQNIYNGKQVRAGKNGQPEFAPRHEGFPRTALGWPITPESLYWGPRFLYERYQAPIYITENGMACHDAVSLDGRVHDPNRIDFMARYLGQLGRAIEDGVKVDGYFHWSLTDNFEWHSGYSQRFGLVYVDFRTQQRILKDSARWYAHLIRTGAAEL